jgi:hypothetical protein
MYCSRYPPKYHIDITMLSSQYHLRIKQKVDVEISESLGTVLGILRNSEKFSSSVRVSEFGSYSAVQGQLVG